MGPRGEGKTALHVAAEHGHASNLAILVEAGASLLIRDNLGELNIYFNRICIFVYFDIQIYKFNKKKLIILIMAKIMPIFKVRWKRLRLEARKPYIFYCLKFLRGMYFQLSTVVPF